MSGLEIRKVKNIFFLKKMFAKSFLPSIFLLTVDMFFPLRAQFCALNGVHILYIHVLDVEFS
jgi:hypothetical protein